MPESTKRRFPRSYLKFLVLPILAALVLWARSRPATVETARPQMRVVVESIAASGSVHGSVESDIGAGSSGRVARLFVRENQRVRAGQVLAQLDERILRAQMAQAQATVNRARAERARAARSPLISELARLRADVQQATETARARLAASRQRLAELQRGPTREETAQAAAQLRAAQVRTAQSAREAARQQQLFEEGVPLAETAAAQSAARVGEQSLAQAEAQLDLARRDLQRQQQLFDTAARAELDRAETALRVAQQNLAKAGADLKLAQKEMERQRRLFEGGAGPRAELDRAQAALETAQSAVELATAQRDQARLDAERQRTIFNEGSVPRSEVERARTAVSVAERTLETARERQAQSRRDVERVRKTYGATGRAALENAQFAERAAQAEEQSVAQRLRQLQVGTRPEQIAQARADVAAAEAAYGGARSSGAAQLQTLLAQPRFEDVAAAQAAVDEASRGAEVARQRLAEALVRAPYGGVVTEILTETGGVTGPGQAILRLVQTGVPEIRVDIDENNLGRLAVGQSAVVTSDAFPGRRFSARVRQIGSEVDKQRGTVEVRLAPSQAPSWLRPGQTLNVNIIVNAGQKRLTVPLTAVKTAANISVVMLIKNGKVVQRRVQTGPVGPDGVPVISGLNNQDEVIVSPGSLVEGNKVQSKR